MNLSKMTKAQLISIIEGMSEQDHIKVMEVEQRNQLLSETNSELVKEIAHLKAEVAKYNASCLELQEMLRAKETKTIEVVDYEGYEPESSGQESVDYYSTLSFMTRAFIDFIGLDRARITDSMWEAFEIEQNENGAWCTRVFPEVYKANRPKASVFINNIAKWARSRNLTTRFTVNGWLVIE